MNNLEDLKQNKYFKSLEIYHNNKYKILTRNLSDFYTLIRMNVDYEIVFGNSLEEVKNNFLNLVKEYENVISDKKLSNGWLIKQFNEGKPMLYSQLLTAQTDYLENHRKILEKIGWGNDLKYNG